MILLIIISIIILLYVVLLLWLIVGFDRVRSFQAEAVAVNTHFSIIIPFRNEAAHLPRLLESLRQIDYPPSAFEVLMVDDASEDDSTHIINTFQQENNDFSITVHQNIRTSQSPKKDAINTAVHKSSCEWIVTTDADCIVPAKWLRILDSFIQQRQPAMVAGPISYIEHHGLLDQFQQLDLFSLIGTTIGSFGNKKNLFCSGANLAYKKEAFFEVNGYVGNDTIASGDDVFLLEKMTAQFPDQVHYLKNYEAIVKTSTEPSWNALLQQRKRWAAKASGYQNGITKIVGLVVLSANLSILILLFGSLFRASDPKWFLFGFLLKFNIDLLLIHKSSRFLRQHVKGYLFGSLLYPFFSVGIALQSLIGGYQWKGRNFKR